MAQIQAPATYNNGDTVTAANLNSHVAGATLLSGAITDQTAASPLNNVDVLLVSQGGALKKVTPVVLFATPQAIGSTTPNTVAATTLTASGLATVGSLTSTGLATAGSLSVGGTSAHTGAATFASTAAFTGAATFDVAPNLNGGANLGNAAADPVVLNCTISGTLKGEPVVDLTSVTAAAADKILIQDASDASKLKVAAFPTQYVKAFVRGLAAGGIVSGSAFNVTSVVRNSTGNYSVTFPAMNSANYVALSNSAASVTAASFASSATVCTVLLYIPTVGYYDADFSLVIFEV